MKNKNIIFYLYIISSIIIIYYFLVIILKELHLKNFRNFENESFFFNSDINLIVGENGKGKTNILEAIDLLSLRGNFLKLDFKDLTKLGNNNFFISSEISNNKEKNQIAISYDKEINKKNFLLNGNKATKNKILDLNIMTVTFSPITMNLMYLSPSLRRDFLDDIIKKSYKNANDTYKKYSKVLINRNKILKNIKDNKSKINELDFWNKEFINLAKEIYNYRIELLKFFNNELKDINGTNLNQMLIKTNSSLKISYKSKIDLTNIEESIKTKLKENINLDIILKRTNIGPHLDDFDILVENTSLSSFASRGETKSIILMLKFLEMKLLEEKIGTKPILLIDDFLSELDEKHKDIILNKLKGYQIFLTSIYDIQGINGDIIKI